MKITEDKVINGLRTFFTKRYSKDVAIDYLSKGKLTIHSQGIDFELENKTYHFDMGLNLKGVTIW